MAALDSTSGHWQLQTMPLIVPAVTILLMHMSLHLLDKITSVMWRVRVHIPTLIVCGMALAVSLGLSDAVRKVRGSVRIFPSLPLTTLSSDSVPMKAEEMKMCILNTSSFMCTEIHVH